MANFLANLLVAISSRMVLDDDPLARRTREPDFVDLVEEARRDWLASLAYFESVSEPDLVDHAIYLLEAAEKKYIYLLRKARDMGVSLAGRRA